MSGAGIASPPPLLLVASGHVAAVAVRIHAVQHEIVVAAACAVGANLLAPGSQLRRIHHVRVRPTRQAENLRVVAIHEWQGFNRFSSNHSAECDVVGLQERRLDDNVLPVRLRPPAVW